MWNWVSKLLKRKTDDRDAFELGQKAGLEIAVDIENFANAILEPRSERFLMVLDQRLTGIVPIEGVTYTDQARIELNVMWENWSERKIEQESEIFDAVVAKWNNVLFALDPNGEVCRETINAKVAEHSVKLFADGIERTAEAIERQVNSRSHGL